jgi:hypothetical protein
VSSLAEKLLALDAALTRAGFAHAFGGAIALAYCTQEPRGTRDLDVNVFARPSRAGEILRALPREVSVDDADIRTARREGQVRVWWADTPIDLFLDVHRFHRRAAEGVRTVPFSGREIPVLGCTALVLFKALFDRTRDWADIEAVADAGAANLDEASAWVAQVLGADHAITRRLVSLAQPDVGL